MLLGMAVLAAAPVYSATIEVAVGGLSFIPADVTINAGDSIHWTGLGAFHNVAEVDDAMDNTWNNGFRSGEVGDVPEFTQVFNTPGIYYYVCEPHAAADMRGSIMVNASAPSVTPWGMAVMAALLLAAAAVVVRRSRRFSVSKVVAGCLGAALLASAPAMGATIEVPVSGFTFSPEDVVINVGDAIHWTGLDGGFHTVAEVDDDKALVWNGGFHSEPIFADEYTFTFNTPGLYYYICEPHGDFGMRGTVMVNAGPQATTLSTGGVVAMIVLVLATGGFVLYRRRQFAFAVIR